MARTNPEDLVLLVDYDSTLFERHEYGNDYWKEVSSQTGLPAEQIYADSKLFRQDERLGGYDFAAHMDKYGLDHKVMRKVADELMHNNDYLFEDSAPFIQQAIELGYKPHILSFGERVWQEGKIIPNLAKLAGVSQAEQDAGHGITFTTTMESKCDYIAQHYPGKTGALVDDVSEQQLRGRFSEVTLDRSSGLPLPRELASGIYVVGTLYQALDVIKTL